MVSDYERGNSWKNSREFPVREEKRTSESTACARVSGSSGVGPRDTVYLSARSAPCIRRQSNEIESKTGGGETIINNDIIAYLWRRETAKLNRRRAFHANYSDPVEEIRR